MPETHFNTRTARISLEEGNFLKIVMLPNVIVDAEDAIDNLLVIKNLSGGEKKLKLIDVRGNWSMTSEAKSVSKKHFAPETTLARAYVVDSFLTKIMLNFLRTFSEAKVPEEFFNQEEEAISWLLSQKQ